MSAQRTFYLILRLLEAILQAMRDEYLSLISVEDPRGFLQKALEIKYKKKGKVNFADFSRKCSFSSRSFVKEYIDGKKELSENSIIKVKTGLKLKRNYSALWSLLIQKHNESANLEESRKIEVKIKNLKKKIELEASIKEKSNSKSVISKLQVFLVYSSLGEVGEFYSLQEIQRKSGLKKNDVLKVIDTLKSHKIIEENDNQFSIVSDKLDLIGLNQDQGLEKLVFEVCSHISKNKKEIIEDKDNLVLFSTCSINKWDMPKIKEEIQDSIFSILDKYQNNQGKTLSQFFVANYSSELN